MKGTRCEISIFTRFKKTSYRRTSSLVLLLVTESKTSLLGMWPEVLTLLRPLSPMPKWALPKCGTSVCCCQQQISQQEVQAWSPKQTSPSSHNMLLNWLLTDACDIFCCLCSFQVGAQIFRWHWCTSLFGSVYDSRRKSAPLQFSSDTDMATHCFSQAQPRGTYI